MVFVTFLSSLFVFSCPLLGRFSFDLFMNEIWKKKKEKYEKLAERFLQIWLGFDESLWEVPHRTISLISDTKMLETHAMSDSLDRDM